MQRDRERRRLHSLCTMSEGIKHMHTCTRNRKNEREKEREGRIPKGHLTHIYISTKHFLPKYLDTCQIHTHTHTIFNRMFYIHMQYRNLQRKRNEKRKKSCWQHPRRMKKTG